MLRAQNSPIHRSENLRCSNLSGRAQSVNRSLLGYPPGSQHFDPISVDQRVSSPTPTTSMEPMLASDRNFQMFHPMDSMDAEYYSVPFTMYSSHLPRPSSYYPTANSGFVADAYDPFMPTPQPSDNPTDFSGMFYEPVAAHQPPVPPAAPDTPTSPTSAFNYHPCRWLGGPQCDGLAPGRNREMGEHLRGYHRFVGHERDTVQCEWENCGQIMQRMNVPRHIVSRHLLAAASCRFCGKRFSRPDVVARHERTCTGALPGVLSVPYSSAVRV